MAGERPLENMRNFESVTRASAAHGALLLRLTLGSLFIAHLYWKVAVYPGGLERWWSNFATNGYPWFVPWYVVSAELAGALFLIPGIAVRWVSLYALPMMIGAAHFWAVRNGFWFVAAGAELPVLWGVLLVLQFLIGSGPYALKRRTGVSA
jgi:putative oxidoreductase